MAGRRLRRPLATSVVDRRPRIGTKETVWSKGYDNVEMGWTKEAEDWIISLFLLKEGSSWRAGVVVVKELVVIIGLGHRRQPARRLRQDRRREWEPLQRLVRSEDESRAF